MYNHFYKDIIPEEILKSLRDYVISPAKLVNMRIEYENKNDFLQELKMIFNS